MEQDPSPTAPGPRPADASTIEAISDVVSVHVNQSHWWNNASFALPLLVAIVSIVIGLSVHWASALVRARDPAL